MDMPIEQLLQYRGTNPCPTDIDEYWDSALAEMNAVDPKAEFIRSDFPAKAADCYDLFFTGTKNARIHAKVAIPKHTEGKVPAVLMFHGLGMSAEEWSDMLKYISQGYVVAYMDARGQGGLSQDIGRNSGAVSYSTPVIRGVDGDKQDLLMRDIYLDTALLAKIIMGLDCVDPDRVGVTGYSQGGALSVACASLVPQIKKCSICYPYLSDFKRVYDLHMLNGAYDGIRFYLRNLDPTHQHFDEFWERLGYISIHNLSKRMQAELKMITALEDVCCPPSTQFAMYNNVTSKKEYVLYPMYGHEAFLKGSQDILFAFLSDL